MTLDVRGLTWSMALLWGGLMLVCGLANLVFPGYAVAFLELAASVYPGYGGPGGIGSVVLVTLYGLVDGAIFGLLAAWLYNRFAGAGDASAALGR